jgi:threonine/homoserine/homoserine lactone efflux protein
MMGAASGFVVSIPLGPTNLAIINHGARRGFGYGCWVGSGAVLMETIYCGVAFAGFSHLFTSDLVRAAFELISFLLMLVLGLKYLTVKSLPSTTRSVELVEHKLHPHTAFMTGFVRVLGNPAVLLFWITLSATFMAHSWMRDGWPSKLACVLGVSTGALGWFVLLSFCVSLGHGRFSEATLVRLAHFSAICLLGAALVLGVRLVTVLSRSHELKAQVRQLEREVQRSLQR